jgi:hypothetical protein
MAKGLVFKIDVKGFEDPLTAFVQVENHDDLMKLLKEMRIFEDPLTARVHIEGASRAITIRTTPE